MMVDDVWKVRVDVCGPPVRSSVDVVNIGLIMSAGTLVAARVTVPVKPSIGVSEIVEDPVLLAWRRNVSGDASIPKSALGVQELDAGA